LKIALKGQGEKKQSETVKNEIVYYWGFVPGGEFNAVIVASFLSEDGIVRESATPTKITIRRGFKGSIKGVHLGDSIEKLIEVGRKQGFSPKIEQGFRPNSQRGHIDLDRKHSVYYDAENNRLTEITIYNGSYSLGPG